ncbi:M16 family metallopeptidase [Leadbetterella sp. DM7]|uniref:M16 family metallopeptidase n=1 Tax=Leadbetterella sp. DM7 TaxID=3235085 RepID=UPI00349ECD74
MINFNYFELNNGLKVYVHEDPKSLTAAFNLCYNVGSRDEHPEKTGFAHLFEHLMFGGSRHIPAFDEPLQKAGGNNNAFTSPDITNYYITLPAQNLETAFWLESDRMMGLSFDPKVLEVQKNVVIEEFKQRYLNQPYGDLWLRFRPLIYRQHPYQWPTIGKEISHIENAVMDDVKDFFYRYYLPSNAVLAVAGPVTAAEVERLARKWFGGIPAGKISPKNFPAEPPQTAPRRLVHQAEVPLKTIYKAYHTPQKYERGQYALDLFGDIFGKGQTSPLYQKLVKEQALFTGISAQNISYLDSGLFLVHGSLAPGISLEEADHSIEQCLEDALKAGDYEEKLRKVKTQALSLDKFGETEILNRAMKIAFAANAGDVNLANTSIQHLEAVGHDEMITSARKFLTTENCNTLLYSPIST